MNLFSFPSFQKFQKISKVPAEAYMGKMTVVAVDLDFGMVCKNIQRALI